MTKRSELLGLVGKTEPSVFIQQTADSKSVIDTAAELESIAAELVRIAGDLDARVERVAVVGGSGDSLFDAVRAAGVDAYVTADLRHHPASELRERAEFEQRAIEWSGLGAASGPAPATPFLVDVAHFASEWPWLERAAADLVADLAVRGTTVVSRVSTLRTDPWTARIPSPERTAP